MRSMRTTRKKVVRDLTRTRHMSAVSAVVLGTIFMPLLGMPDVYEVRAFHEVMSGWSAAHAQPRDYEAARLRTAEVVAPVERSPRGWWREVSDRLPEVRRVRTSQRDDATLAALTVSDAAAEPMPVLDEGHSEEFVADLELDEEAPLPEVEEDFEPLPAIEEPMVEEEPMLDEKV